MLLKIKSFPLVIAIISVLLFLPACKKFDRSKIAMPKMKFITGENLHSVIARDPTHVWVFGNHGTIYFSGDGGTTWNKQETGVEVLLGDASFVSNDEGWAAGVAGTVLHTVNGGKTWGPLKSCTERDLLNVFFLDNRQGWAVGEYGTLIHTDDGGATWAPQMEPTDKNYNSIFFADQNTGWLVGEFGTILYTENGGKTWAPQECKDIVPVVSSKEWEKPLPALYGIFFLDRNQGWITGMDGVLIRTVDGGKTWKKLASNTDKPIYSILVKGNSGWAVGNKGTYLMSHDGGNTWQPKEKAVKTKYWLRQVAFPDQNTGFIVGATGTVAVTKDSGNTWKIISGFTYEMEEFGLADF